MNLFRALVSLLLFGVILSFTGCEKTIVSEIKEQEVESSGIFNEEQSLPEEKITYLEKVGEIGDGFCDGELNYFARITSICIDREDNLYVADSGHHKIFKLGSDGKLITYFGRQGQGPGEFLGRLRISAGNDGKIYVTDDGNWRLIRFLPSGEFSGMYPIVRGIYDEATVNSEGDIYLISKSGIKLIECYDSNFKFKRALIDFDYHLQFPYDKPSSLIGLRFPNNIEVIKLITKNDNLVVISNFSMKSFIFDRNNRKINEFNIEENEFVEDFKKKLKKVKKQEIQLKAKFGSRSKSSGYFYGFSLPFKAFIDYDDTICLVYKKSDNTSYLYKYELDGTLFGISKFPEKIDGLHLCSDSSGRVYAIRAGRSEIDIYK